MAVVEKSGLGPNKTFMPIRQAVTGKKISPPIDYTLALLPKDVAMSRLHRVLDGRAPAGDGRTES
jgi:glutamyl/glutaminyl-tRNA synthetase